MKVNNAGTLEMSKDERCALDAYRRCSGDLRITGGSWHVEAIKLTDGTPMYRVLNSCGLGIADFATWADAIACAATPDLISAAQNARNVLAAFVTGDLKSIKADSPALLELRAAIAKAEGR
jgi:hypothetical protein